MSCKPMHVLDGYALNASDGYSFTTNWIEVDMVNQFSISAIFTGGNPIGTLKLQQSNDIPDVSMSKPQWANTNTSGSFVNDTADVPPGTGINSASVNGPGVYVLNQYLFGYTWVRVVYTASTSANTTYDIRMTVKNNGN